MNSQPREILKHILEHVPKQYLICLMRVSKEWKYLIEKIFYSDKQLSLEECVIQHNYLYARQYLNSELSHFNKMFITYVNDTIFIKHYHIDTDQIDMNYTQDIYTKTGYAEHDLLVYYSKLDNISVINYLLRRGYLVQPGHGLFETASKYVLKYGHIDVTQLLLSSHEHYKNFKQYIQHVVITSARYGHLELIKSLLEKYKSIIDTTNCINIAFKRSVWYWHLDVVKLLIEKGADIHVDNEYALHWSAYSGNIKFVKFFLKKGANLYINNNNALRVSALNGHTDVVKLLLEKGADINVLSEELQERYKKLIN